jgi:hypothetical protein
MITKAQLNLVIADHHRPIWNDYYVQRYDLLAQADSGNLIMSPLRQPKQHLND